MFGHGTPVCEPVHIQPLRGCRAINADQPEVSFGHLRLFTFVPSGDKRCGASPPLRGRPHSRTRGGAQALGAVKI